MSLILAANSRESIWMLADRRLSYRGRPPKEDGRKMMFLEATDGVAKAPGEWQTLDITLVGRLVSVVLNGKAVINRQEIPGITGGALDGDETGPGPLMLQGDHGPVEFRAIVLIPAK